MALSDQIASYTEDVVGFGHPTLPDVQNRAFLFDHDRYGGHKRLAYSTNLTNKSGSSLAVGSVVIQDTANAGGVKLTTAAASTAQVFVVGQGPAAEGVPVADSEAGYFIGVGFATVLVTGAVAIGDFLGTSTTSARAASLGATAVAGGFAIAFSANASGLGTVTALLLGSTAVTAAAGVMPLGRILSGGTISNDGTDPTNDLAIAAGEYVSDDAAAADRVKIVVAALIKQLDVAWAVGTNAGGRSSAAAIANTTYHLWAVQRPDTGVTDVIMDVSATAPTMPTNYTKKCWIGEWPREAGALVLMTHDGPFYTRPSVLDTDVNNPPGTAVTRTASVAIGNKVWALLNVGVHPETSGIYQPWLLSDLDVADVAPSPTAAPLSTVVGINSAANALVAVQARIRTNAAGQFRSRAGAASGANDHYRIAVTGWENWRGRV